MRTGDICSIIAPVPAGVMELVDVTDSKSVGLIPRVGSSPTTGTKSEQAAYCLLRLFSKVRAHPLRCSSFPNRTRFAGLRFGFGHNLKRKAILPTYCRSEISTRVQFPPCGENCTLVGIFHFWAGFAALDSCPILRRMFGLHLLL